MISPQEEQRARQATVEAGFLSEVARLEATVTRLQHPPPSAVTAAAGAQANVAAAAPAASPASPAASLGAASDCCAGAGSEACTPGAQIVLSGLPHTASAHVPEGSTVYNVVMVPAGSPRSGEQSRRSSRDEERLTSQVGRQRRGGLGARCSPCLLACLLAAWCCGQ